MERRYQKIPSLDRMTYTRLRLLEGKPDWPSLPVQVLKLSLVTAWRYYPVQASAGIELERYFSGRLVQD